MKKTPLSDVDISRLFPLRSKKSFDSKSKEASVIRVFSCLCGEYITAELFYRVLGPDFPLLPILEHLSGMGIIRKNDDNNSYILCLENTDEDLGSSAEFKTLISMISNEVEKARKTGDFASQKEWMDLGSTVLENARLFRPEKHEEERSSILNSSVIFCSVIISGKETAIGIKYDEENMFAPMITFIEKGSSAESIITTAKNIGVRVVINNMLAKNLFSLAKIGQSIPESTYRDVSLILARNGTQRLGRHIKRFKTSRRLNSIEISPPLSIELGTSLYSLLKEEQGKVGYLEKTLEQVKTKLEKLLGFDLPEFRINNNTEISHDAYRIFFKGLEAGQGRMDQNWYSGTNVKSLAKAAFAKISDHINLIAQRYAPELLGRDEVSAILEAAEESYPILCGEVKSLLPLGPIREVLQSLVSENISIKPIDVILETLADWSSFGPAPGEFIVEQIRLALKRQICLDYTDDKLTLRVLTLEPELEKKFLDFSNGASPDSTKPEAFEDVISRAQSKMEKMGYPPVILCSPRARFLLKEITKKKSPYLAVLSYVEIPSDIRVEQVGEIGLKGNING